MITPGVVVGGFWFLSLANDGFRKLVSLSLDGGWVGFNVALWQGLVVFNCGFEGWVFSGIQAGYWVRDVCSTVSLATVWLGGGLLGVEQVWWFGSCIRLCGLGFSLGWSLCIIGQMLF